MSDFIREVDDEYRRDRVVNFLGRYQLLLIGIVIAIVAGAAGYRYYMDHKVSLAEAANVRYEAALQLMRDGKSAEAQTAFEAIEHDAPAGYAMLSQMKSAEALALRDPAAAAKAFDAIANDNDMDPVFRDTARLRGAMILAGREDPQLFEKHFAPFATDAFPFHASLRELLGLVALQRGDTEGAGRWFDQIIVDPRAPEGLRNRAQGFLSLVASGPVSAAAPSSTEPAPAAPQPATPASPAPADSASAPAASPATPAGPAPAK